MTTLTMLCLPACLLLLLLACQQQPTPPAANQEALVNELFDTYSSTTKEKDVAGVSALLAEEGLVVGTDPGEFWNKKRLAEEFGKMVENSTFTFEMTLEKREVRISREGAMALAVE